tara:strand:+ start:83 stop:595 length:513 start_codon:yes stop_codon:yes gene_type:complete
MQKFERSRLYSFKIKERIQRNIDMAKEIGVDLTWKQSKEMQRELDKQEIWVNDIYQVNILRGKDCDQYIHIEEFKGKCDYITIKTHDKKAIRDWRHFQTIKNELCGENKEAVEIFPSEKRLVDTANQYHLWVLPKGQMFPFGFDTRKVDYTERHGGLNKVGQRPLEESTI